MHTPGAGSAPIKRRSFLKLSGLGAAAVLSPVAARAAGAVAGATPEERAINGARALKKKVGLNLLMWGQFYKGQTTKLAREFEERTGIGIANVTDVSAFAMPQRVMAEAVARSAAFDIVHVDAHMFPSLVAADYVQPLDKLMERGGYVLESVGPQAQFCRYRGETYGLMTDGNVMTMFVRKDLVEQHQKRYEDRFGRKFAVPDTYEEYFDLGKFLFEASEGKINSFAELRSRKSGAPAYFMMPFYSAGGFPFADDMTPTLATDAGRYAMDFWLKTKPYQVKEAPNWGQTQLIPYFVGGNFSLFSFWNGAIHAVEGEKSPTRGKWLYAPIPGSRASGKLVKRSISYTLSSYAINRRSANVEAAYWLCQYLNGPEHSTRVVSDAENPFHDAWHPRHMTDARVQKAYTPDGLRAIARSLQVTSPAILLTGFLEFWDLLDKNLADAYVGTITGDQALKQTEEEWKGVIRRVGVQRLREDLATYKAAMPKAALPA